MKQALLNAGTMGHQGWVSLTIDLPHGMVRCAQRLVMLLAVSTAS